MSDIFNNNLQVINARYMYINHVSTYELLIAQIIWSMTPSFVSVHVFL